MERKIYLPDWRGNRVSLPEEGQILPEYSFTFFPYQNKADLLEQSSPEDLARLIRRHSDLTSKFLHEAISRGRFDVALKTVGILGGPEIAIDFVQKDWHRILCEMTFDFVPGEEIERIIAKFHELGFTGLTDTRTNLHRIKPEGLKDVKEKAPNRKELQAYANLFNSEKLNRYGTIQNTEDVRIVDPRRGLRYVGLGKTGRYDWVDIATVEGFNEASHYTAPDSQAKIALLSVY